MLRPVPVFWRSARRVRTPAFWVWKLVCGRLKLSYVTFVLAAEAQDLEVLAPATGCVLISVYDV